MSRYKKIGLAVLIVGLAAGSIVTNMTYESNYYFLAELNLNLTLAVRGVQENMIHYATYMLGKRLTQMMLLAVVLRLFVLEAVIGVLGFLGSFSFGMFFTYQLLQSGGKGIWMIFAAVFPQWLCYGVAGYFWMRGESDRGKQKAYQSYVFMIIMFIIGILMEMYVTPKLMILQIS